MPRTALSPLANVLAAPLFAALLVIAGASPALGQAFGVAPTVAPNNLQNLDDVPPLRGAQPTPVPREVTEANRSLRRNDPAEAESRLQPLLDRDPREPRGRFTLGLIRIEQGRAGDAIEIFTSLTQDFPELPEPYNNLAVLQVQQGKLEAARTSLLAALRANPNDPVAQENLGDVYVMLARQSFEAALKGNAGNRAARAKLAVLRDLASLEAGGSKPAAQNSVPRRTDVQQAEGVSR